MTHHPSDDLFVALYDDLHRMAAMQLRNGGNDLTLGATTLLHEAYLNLAARDPIAETQQFHLAVGRDEDIGRFQVAVYDQVRMYMTDGVQHLEQQMHALLARECGRLSVSIDWLSVDEFEDEIRLTRRRDTGVQQACDGRMCESRERRVRDPAIREALE